MTPLGKSDSNVVVILNEKSIKVSLEILRMSSHLYLRYYANSFHYRDVIFIMLILYVKRIVGIFPKLSKHFPKVKPKKLTRIVKWNFSINFLTNREIKNHKNCFNVLRLRITSFFIDDYQTGKISKLYEGHVTRSYWNLKCMEKDNSKYKP